MKRVTADQLEQLSFQNHVPIEIDETEGIAVCTVKGRDYYASLPAPSERAS